jgi:metacaspase-1
LGIAHSALSIDAFFNTLLAGPAREVRRMAKRALCVGINDYPDSSMDLAGCVNDARDWGAVLAARGYAVTTLLDGDATRAGLLDALATLVSASRGDTLVFTFSGHGSWLPDADRDEPDARDEMLCPHDVMQDRYVLDDDLHRIFSGKPADVPLFMIADCCHSGTVVRYSAPKLTPVPIKARFLPPYVFARGDRNVERAIDRALNTPAPTKLQYPVLLFSGCQDTEFSYDTLFNGRPNGAFTRTAIDALQHRAPATPQAWYEDIRRTLPSDTFPQTPQVFGARDALDGEMF